MISLSQYVMACYIVAFYCLLWEEHQLVHFHQLEKSHWFGQKNLVNFMRLVDKKERRLGAKQG